MVKQTDEIEKQRVKNLARRVQRTTNARSLEAAAHTRMRHTFQTLYDLGSGTLTDNPTTAKNFTDATATLRAFNQVFHHWLGEKVRKPLHANPETMQATADETARREAEFQRLYPHAYAPTTLPAPDGQLADHLSTKSRRLANTPDDLEDVDINLDELMAKRPRPRAYDPTQIGRPKISLMESLSLNKKKVYTEAQKREMIQVGEAYIDDKTGEFIVEYERND